MNGLIFEYFDRPLGRDESKELSELLENDEESARAFARLARSDLAIEKHLASAEKAVIYDAIEARILSEIVPLGRTWIPDSILIPFSVPSARKLARWGAVAAVVALLFVSGWHAFKDGARSVAAELAVESQANPQIAESGVPIPAGHSFAAGLDHDAKRVAAQLRTRLGKFYLPSISLSPTTLDQALEAVERAMEECDHRGWLRETEFAFRVDADDFDGEKRVRLARENLSVLEALQLLAIQTGKQIEFGPECVEFVALKEDPDGPLFSRVFNLPRVALQGDPYDRFTTDINLAPEVVEFGGLENHSPFGADVFGGQLASSMGEGSFSQAGVLEVEELSVQTPEGMVHFDGATLELGPDGIVKIKSGSTHFSSHVPPDEQLAQWGIELSQDSEVEWIEDAEDPASGQLTVRARQENLARISTLLSGLDDSPHAPLVSVKSRIFEVPEGLVVNDAVLDSAEVEGFVSEISAIEETVSVSFPSVITRNAQPAMVESTLEVTLDASDGTVVNDSQGVAFSLLPVLDGELVRLSAYVDYGFIPEEKAQPTSEGWRLHPDSPVIHHDVELEAFLGTGEAAVFSMAGIEPGKTLVYVIEAQRQ